MVQHIRVRDVVRATTANLGPQQRALRVPYDMFHPKGAVLIRDGSVEWAEGQEVRSARYTEAVLGDCHPGERVLICLTPSAPEPEWCLYEVESVE
ncbi:MAG TPA: hypothetical protein VIJ22_14235 [Polyangiaceae bacterium]